MPDDGAPLNGLPPTPMRLPQKPLAARLGPSLVLLLAAWAEEPWVPSPQVATPTASFPFNVRTYPSRL